MRFPKGSCSVDSSGSLKKTITGYVDIKIKDKQMKLTKDSAERETELEQALVSLSMCFSDHIKYEDARGHDIEGTRKLISDCFQLGMKPHTPPRPAKEVVADYIQVLKNELMNGDTFTPAENIKALLKEAEGLEI